MGHKGLDFSAIKYGWYIEMWIGLFLLVPFLNILWQNIPTQRLKLLLLGTLYVMTALPDMANRYGMHLVPGFWADCYPLLFFFSLVPLLFACSYATAWVKVKLCRF